MMLPVNAAASQGLTENVLAAMKSDGIAQAVKGNELIIKLGQSLYDRHGSHEHLHGFISQKMRELVRFLLEVKTIDKDIVSLRDCITPNKFKAVVEGVNRVAGYDVHTQVYSNVFSTENWAFTQTLCINR
jgi:hypothetical protein